MGKNDIPSVEDLLIKASLYKEYDISELLEEDILRLEYFQGAVDAYCIECKQTSTFRSEVNLPRKPSHSARIVAMMDPEDESIKYKMDGFYAYKDRTFTIELSCTRVPDHRIRFFFVVWKDNLIKVGQYPSLADLQQQDLDKYKGILTKDKRDEFKNAIRLYAHGIGIGSFVYLRRIFESLIEKAHEQAREQPDWDEDAYSGKRMDERISILKDYLPETLVKNAGIYSILSKGIHALSEDECLEYFDVLKGGIEDILDEEVERRNKEEREKRRTGAIAKIKGRLT